MSEEEQGEWGRYGRPKFDEDGNVIIGSDDTLEFRVFRFFDELDRHLTVAEKSISREGEILIYEILVWGAVTGLVVALLGAVLIRLVCQKKGVVFLTKFKDCSPLLAKVFGGFIRLVGILMITWGVVRLLSIALTPRKYLLEYFTNLL